MHNTHNTCPMLRDNPSLHYAPCSMDVIDVIDGSNKYKVLLCRTCNKRDYVDINEVVRQASSGFNLMNLFTIILIALAIATLGESRQQNPQIISPPSQSSQG